MNYYNENDKRACFWLRELMAAGLIPEGKIDERSVIDVQPADLAGFTQHHFFAGIGGWARALWLACWPAGRPVWTVSCPCQPFSVAGKKKGEADERHLWPKIEQLIRACQPATVFGEQVSSKAGVLWLSRVFADLESLGYQRAGTDLCAAGIGAPHIRQRLYWVGHAESNNQWRDPVSGEHGQRQPLRGSGGNGGVAQSGQQSKGGRLHGPRESNTTNQSRASGELRGSSLPIGLADTQSGGCGISGRAPWSAGHPEQCDEARRLADTERDGGRTDEPGRGAQKRATDLRADQIIGLEHAKRERLQGHDQHEPNGGEPGWLDSHAPGSTAAAGSSSGVANSDGGIAGNRGLQRGGEHLQREKDAGFDFWGNYWHLCRDGRTRRISPEPSVFPLAHGLPGRVALLRGAGNAIVPAVAAEFIKAYLEI